MADMPPFPPDEPMDFADEGSPEPEIEGLLPPEEEEGGGNRTFLYAVGALVAFMLVMLLAFGAYAMLILPRQRAAKQTQAAQINAQNTQIAQAITQTAEALQWTPTPTETAVPTSTSTPLPSPTPVVARPSATPKPPQPAVDTAALAMTATAVYLAQAAPGTPTPTQLPSTGFGDVAQFPTLALAAVLLVALILVVRRLRVAQR